MLGARIATWVGVLLGSLWTELGNNTDCVMPQHTHMHTHACVSADLFVQVQSQESTRIPPTPFQHHRVTAAYAVSMFVIPFSDYEKSGPRFPLYITYWLFLPSYRATASLSCLPCLAPHLTLHLQRTLRNRRRKGERRC